MNNFFPAASLPDLAFGLDSECEFSSAYHFSKLLDQFSIALEEYRLQHDLGQKDLADLLQISQSMVSQYENGSRNISLKTLCEHCEKLRLVPRLSFDCSSETSSVQPTNTLQLPESDSLSSQFA